MLFFHYLCALNAQQLMHIAFTTLLPEEGFRRIASHELYTPLEQADVLVSTFDKPVTREMIMSAPKLQLVANFGVGFNNIDLEACRERGIRVTNTPNPVIEPTAELAFALMHDVARRTAEFDRKLREGKAEPFGVMNNLSHSLYGKTLGIIGMGRIGQALARRAVASGMRVVYHNRRPLGDEAIRRLGYEARYVSKEELLQIADFVSLNLPYTPEVKHIIDGKALRMMKPTAYLINTARGAHVDEQALVKALKEGEIAGAAMDVYEHEPQITPELLEMDNVVLSPHTGTGTWEGRIAMCENVCDNILAWQNNEIDKLNIVL
ncbi:MAG: NAD(P)-binding domain-containing protein [Paludibacteraceae bacterium]|nr:NAD(P)-binding domain-containing protein [Paludibacteraceae bacterium]